MEQHGKNPRQNVIAIIPARLESSRLANKLLLDLAGKPLILHTVEQAKKARNVLRVIVATDSESILKVIEANGHEAVLTSENHQSGSDRIAKVAESLPAGSIIVNVQGDEPLIPPATIEAAVAAILENQEIQMATTCEPIDNAKDILSPDVVKVVTDENDFALYFSRSPIPFPRDAVKQHSTLESTLLNEPGLISLFRKHTGLYVYRREFLLQYTKLKQTNLEKTEMLEQLRALENGVKIKVIEVAESSIGVGTQEDFERVQKILEERQKIIYREAVAADIPQIARVHVESWQKSFIGVAPQNYLDKISIETRIKRFEEAFAQTCFYKMFVAETLEDGIVGFADFGKAHQGDSTVADLYAIYFLPEFQRKGIGGNLFRLCQKEMLGYGFTSMSLDALEKSPYRGFYDKMGGRVVGTGKYKLGEVEFETLIYHWENLNRNE